LFKSLIGCRTRRGWIKIRSTLASLGAGTLTDPHIWGFFFNTPVYGGFLKELPN